MRGDAKRALDEVKEEMDRRGGKTRQYGRAKKAEAAAKKRYEQACAETGTAYETAEKCRQKQEQAKEKYQKLQQEARMLRRMGRAAAGPAAEWVVDVSEQFQSIGRYAQMLGQQGEDRRKETEAAMAHFRESMERAAEQLREDLRQMQNVVAKPRNLEVVGDDDLGLPGMLV